MTEHRAVHGCKEELINKDIPNVGVEPIPHEVLRYIKGRGPVGDSNLTSPGDAGANGPGANWLAVDSNLTSTGESSGASRQTGDTRNNVTDKFDVPVQWDSQVQGITPHLGEETSKNRRVATEVQAEEVSRTTNHGRTANRRGDGGNNGINQCDMKTSHHKVKANQMNEATSPHF